MGTGDLLRFLMGPSDPVSSSEASDWHRFNGCSLTMPIGFGAMGAYGRFGCGFLMSELDVDESEYLCRAVGSRIGGKVFV